MPEWEEEIRLRLADLKLEPTREAEIVEELAQHLEDRYRELLAGGATDDQASRLALAELSDTSLLARELKHIGRQVARNSVVLGAGRMNLIGELWQDLRYGARMLLKKPGFTSVAVFSLALGVGANTAIFSLIDKLLWRSLPVKDPDQLVLVSAESVSPRFTNTIFSYPDYVDYRNKNDVFSGLIAFSRTEVNLDRGGEFQRVNLELVSGNYFDVLGVNAELGRAIEADDDRAVGAAPVVVISYGLWKSGFGGSQNIVGQTVKLADGSYTVIGVAPASFRGMRLEVPADFWAPITMEPQLSASPVPNLDQRSSSWLRVVGRVKQGVSVEQARVELDVLARQIREANTPESERGRPFYERNILLENCGKGISILRNKLGFSLKLLMAVVGLVLLIACANVANLLLARSASRRREIAVRLALGATRRRIVSQLLTESSLLALIGGGAGLLLAPWLNETLLQFERNVDTSSPFLRETLELRVLAFTLLISLASSAVFGLVPALQSSRQDLVPALKQEGSAMGYRQRRLGARNLLVVGQVALSVIVLVSAGLLIKSLKNLFAIDPGFKPDKVLLVPIDLPARKYSEADARQFRQNLIERLQALPGVEGVADGLVVPLSGSTLTKSVQVEGYEAQQGEKLGIDANIVGPRYHEVLNIPIVAGRGFTDRDRKGAPLVAIINEAMARLYFPNGDPIGKRLIYGEPLEIVGVMRDAKYSDLMAASLPHFDTVSLQEDLGRFSTLHIRTTGDPASIVSAVRKEVSTLDPGLVLSNIHPMKVELANSIASQRMAATLTSLFGVAVLLLAAIGLYGVISYSVNRRTREIGIRMALGAQLGDVRVMVLRESMQPVVAGVSIGVFAAFTLTRFIASLLFGVSPTDPTTFVLISLLLTGVALGACLVPARRATKVDPMVALRYE